MSLFLNVNHSSGYVVECHCGFNLHFFEYLFMGLFSISVSSFLKCADLLPIFDWIISLLTVELKERYIFWVHVFHCFRKYFLLFGGLPFHFLNSFFGRAKVFNLDGVHFIFFFSFIKSCASSYPKKTLPNPKSQNFLFFFPES